MDWMSQAWKWISALLLDEWRPLRRLSQYYFANCYLWILTRQSAGELLTFIVHMSFKSHSQKVTSAQLVQHITIGVVSVTCLSPIIPPLSFANISRRYAESLPSQFLAAKLVDMMLLIIPYTHPSASHRRWKQCRTINLQRLTRQIGSTVHLNKLAERFCWAPNKTRSFRTA